MKTGGVGIFAAMACFAGGCASGAIADKMADDTAADGAVVASAGASDVVATEAVEATAEAKPAEQAASAADLLRSLLEETGVTFKEERNGARTEFSFHLSMDENSVEEYRCTAGVEEGAFYASCWAVLPLTIPEDRLDDVAAALASWNGEQACGRFGLDSNRRAAYFVSDIPVESLARKDPMLTLTLVGMPMVNMARKDAVIRAITRGETPGGEEAAPWIPVEREGDGTGAGGLRVGHGVEVGGTLAATGADAGMASPVSGDTANDSYETAVALPGPGEVDIPTCDLVLRWITARGVDPELPPSGPKETTFQFPVGLSGGAGILTDATAQITVMENWVYALVSPNIRVPADARRRVSRTLIELSGKDDGITFMWLPGGRVAARAVVPAALVDDNPEQTVSGLINRAGQAINRRSRELLSSIATK